MEMNKIELLNKLLDILSNEDKELMSVECAAFEPSKVYLTISVLSPSKELLKHVIYMSNKHVTKNLKINTH